MIDIKFLKTAFKKLKTQEEITNFFKKNELTLFDYINDGASSRQLDINYFILKSKNKPLIQYAINNNASFNCPYFQYSVKGMYFPKDSSLIKVLSEQTNLFLLTFLYQSNSECILSEKVKIFDIYLKKNNYEGIEFLLKNISYTRNDLLKVEDNFNYTKIMMVNVRTQLMLSLPDKKIDMISYYINNMEFEKDAVYIESSLKAYNNTIFEKILSHYGYYKWKDLFQTEYKKITHMFYSGRETPDPLDVLIRQRLNVVPKIKYILDNYAECLSQKDYHKIKSFVHFNRDITPDLISYFTEKKIVFETKYIEKFTLNEMRKDKGECFRLLLNISDIQKKNDCEETAIKIMKGITRNYDIHQFNIFISIMPVKFKRYSMLDILVIAGMCVKVQNMKEENRKKFIDFFNEAYQILESKGLSLNIIPAKKKEDYFMTTLQNRLLKKQITINNEPSGKNRGRL